MDWSLCKGDFIDCTDKERAFIEAYIGDGPARFNAYEAARQAGYQSPKDANRILYREHVRRIIVKEFDRLGMGREESIARISEMARAKYADFIQPNGDVDLEGLLEAGYGFLIKKIEKDSRGNIKSVEFYDAAFALDRIFKILGVYVNKTELSGPNGGPIEIASLEDLSPEEIELRAEALKRLAEKKRSDEAVVIEGRTTRTDE